MTATFEPGTPLSDDEQRRVDEFEAAEYPAEVALSDAVTFLQGRRRDTLRALRACVDADADYWRWQGHAELSRQLLERLGAEVPR